MNLAIEYLPTGDLRPYERNARKHGDEDVTAIVASIEEFGFDDPIGVWGPENIIVEGHGRLQAAKRLGMKTVPVIRLDHLTDEQRRAYALAHNRTAELSQWDLDIQGAELASIENIDMTAFGFNAQVIPEEDPDVVEDDFDGEPPEEAETKPGDMFQLGEHVLLCGDASSPEDMTHLMGPDLADMVFTDPPYGVAIGDKNKELERFQKSGRITENIEGDTMTGEDLREMLRQAFTNMRSGCKDDASYYVTSPQGQDIGPMMETMKAAGLPVRHNLIWVKNVATFSMGRLDYDYRHEPIFYTWTKSHNFYGGNDTSVIDDTEAIEKATKSELKEMVLALMGRKQDSVIYCDKPQRCNLHPTMKPVKLVGKFITNNTRRGDIVLDIFGGSGSTIIAAEQLGRRCRMMEIDPRYCDVIVRRWEEFTGKKAVKL